MSRLNAFATWVLRAAGAAALLGLAYVLAHPDRFFISAPRALSVLIPLSALLVAGALAGKLQAATRIKVLFLGVSVAFGAYTVELASALLRSDPFVTAIDHAAASGRPFDPRSTLEVVRELRAQGKRAFPRLTPAALRRADSSGELHSRLRIDGQEALVVSGVSRATVVVCNELGPWAVYETDEHGFNNPRGLWARAPVEVVAVGDSIVMGHCVPEPQNAVGQLRRSIPTAINLGYSGHSPGYSLAALVEYARRVEPRHVLWFHSENDLEWYEVGEDARTPMIMRYLESEPGGFSQRLFERRPEVDRVVADFFTEELQTAKAKGIPAMAEDARGSLLQRAKSVLLLARLRGLIEALGTPADPSRAPNPALYERILARAKREVESWGGQLHVVYVPGAQEFSARGNAAAYGLARDTVRGTAKDLGLPLVDLHERLSKLKDPQALYAYRGHSSVEGYGVPHPTAEGYATIAKAVYEHLAPRLQRAAPPGPAKAGVEQASD